MAWENFAEGDSGVPLNKSDYLNEEHMIELHYKLMQLNNAKADDKLARQLVKISDDRSLPYEYRKTVFDLAHQLWLTAHHVYP